MNTNGLQGVAALMGGRGSDGELEEPGMTLERIAGDAVDDDSFDAPRTLLELPRRFVVTMQDMGLPRDVPLGELARAADSGDPAATAACAKALEYFLALMDEDTEQRTVVNMKGIPKTDVRGRARTRTISRWGIEGMEGAIGVRSGVPAPAGLWAEIVRVGWLTKILPRLSFFSDTPDVESMGKHTQALISRRLNAHNPRRARWLAVVARVKAAKHAPSGMDADAAEKIEKPAVPVKR